MHSHRSPRTRISAFIEEVYYSDRPHSALGYKSLVAFEANVRKAEAANQMIATALYYGIKYYGDTCILAIYSASSADA